MEEKNLIEAEIENLNLATEIDTLEMFQDNPFTFIEEAWGLTAQPPHLEYRDYILKLYTIPYHEWSDYVSTITAKMFQPFQNGKHITWQQSLLLIAVQRAITEADFPKLIAVKAGRGTGKSNVLSMLILWYLFSFPLSKIPCTAPTADQLFAVLWSEANLMLSKMKPEFAGQYEWTSSFIKMKAHPIVWYARAKTSAKGQTGSLAGVHSVSTMAVADEAYDIEDEVFQVADATQTGDNSLMIIVGNAVRDTGYFYDAFNDHKDSWIRITMNAEESPVVNRKKIEAQEKMYGRLSNHYRQSVLGEFPIATAVDINGWRRLFDDDWVENIFTYASKDVDDTQNENVMNELFALKNWQTGRVFLGIDPAGEGDDEAVGYIHNGQLAMKVFNRQVVDDITLANLIIDTVNTYHIESMDITVDSFGVGAEVSKNVLLASDGRISPEGKNVGDKCEELLDQQVYSNEKARLYDMLYWWGKRGGKVFYDQVLKEELKTIFARRTDTGKLQIMGKREMRKRDYKSPNRTEALILSFFNDRMMSNYIPRGDYRGVTAFPKPRQSWLYEKQQKKVNDSYDRFSSIPFM